MMKHKWIRLVLVCVTCVLLVVAIAKIIQYFYKH